MVVVVLVLVVSVVVPVSMLPCLDPFESWPSCTT
jgi:hypothetical protein